MPPSIPSPSGVNDTSTGGVTTRLPLIQEATRNSKKFNKSSSLNTTKVQRPSSGIGRPDRSRSSSQLLLNHRRKKLSILNNKLKSGRSSSPSPRKRSITRNVENDFESDNDINSSLIPDPVASSSPFDATGLAPYGGMGTVSPYGFYGGAASMMSPSPFMGMGMNTTGLPYLSGLNQIVFNVQNIIFSITQAVHLVGANQQALQQAWESLNQMIDNAVVTFHEMRALESIERECETEEEREKRKRLKALRYAFVFGGGWLAYKLVRNLLFRKRILHRQPAPMLHGNNYYGQSNPDYASMASPGTVAMSNYSSPNNYHGAMNMGYPGHMGNHHHSLGYGGYY